MHTIQPVKSKKQVPGIPLWGRCTIKWTNLSSIWQLSFVDILRGNLLRFLTKQVDTHSSFGGHPTTSQRGTTLVYMCTSPHQHSQRPYHHTSCRLPLRCRHLCPDITARRHTASRYSYSVTGCQIGSPQSLFRVHCPTHWWRLLHGPMQTIWTTIKVVSLVSSGKDRH